METAAKEALAQALELSGKYDPQDIPNVGEIDFDDFLWQALSEDSLEDARECPRRYSFFVVCVSETGNSQDRYVSQRRAIREISSRHDVVGANRCNSVQAVDRRHIGPYDWIAMARTRPPHSGRAKRMVSLTPDKRSRIMRAIRSHGNGSTELRFISILRAARITGWRRRQKLPGQPDFVFRSSRIAVFIDGCFWHCCPRCFLPPRQNTSYWEPKLARNRERDKKVSKQLREANWRVLRFWEHQLERPAGVLRQLKRELEVTIHRTDQG